MVFDRDADGEVVEALKPIIIESQNLVNGIVEVAADSRRAGARRLGLEIQDLADHARLPIKIAVEPGPVSANRPVELGNHADAEETVSGDVLMTAQRSSSLATIRLY